MSHNEKPTAEESASLDTIEKDIIYFTGTQDGLLMALRQVEQNGSKKGRKNIAGKIARGEAHIQNLLSQRAKLIEAKEGESDGGES